MNRLSLEQRARLALQARKEETTPKKRVIPRRVGSGPAALSFPQSRLWFLDQFAPGSAVAYNIPAAVRLTGSLNLPALEQTFSEIVRRHESLRTTFTEIEGAPMQVIGAAQPIKLSLIDLSVLPAAEREAEARRLAAAEAREAFALSQGPLIRIKLLKLGAQEHVLLITMHHIITDGWSIGIFIREMCALYCAFSAGHPSPLGELSLQYADFAAWQQEGLQGEALEQQLSYWKEQLTGAPPLLELLTDYVRPPVQSFYGGREQLKLSSSLTKALRELSRREGTTMFMTLLAGFKLLLHRLTAQDDIVVGSPIAGRTQAEIEPLIGYFVNMLALRTGLSGELTFRQLLGRVRQVTLGAYAHQDVPFELLVEKLQAGRNPSHTPLFQVLFNMLNFQAQEQGMSLSGLKVEPFASGEFDSKFDLTLYAEEGEEEIQLDLIYNRDLFAPARIVEMLRQFEHLLSQIVSQPDEKISSFSLVTRAAEISLPIPSQALTANWEGALHMPFSRQAQRAPERLAVRDQQDAWTYAELDARSNQLANYLRASGIKPREVVAIYGHRSASLVWAILGVLKAGAAFVILDPEYPTDRLIDCLRLASPRGWLQVETARELPKALEEFLGSLSCCCRLVLPRRSIAEQRRTLADYPSTNPSVSVGPDDLAYIAFTSGSMGLPKGISGGHKPLSHFLQWHIERFGLAESDHFSMLSGLAHDPLLRDIFTPLWLGATLLIPAQEQILDPGELSRWMKQEQISVAHLTPALGQLLCGTGGGADGPGDESMTLASLRYLFVGGDQLTYGDVSKFRAIAPAVTCVNFYGATETPQAMGYFVVPPQENEDQINLGEGAARQRKSIPLGKGIADVQLLVINQCEQLSGVGEVGELYVRTPYLAFGYLNDEVLTGEKFITNPFTGLSRDRLYRTGDLGRYLPNGDIEFLGRRDNQAKIRGYRIELGDVEAVLVKHPSVRDAAVLLLEDRAGAKRLVAYVVAKQEPKHLVREVRAFLRERLPEYMLPTDYVLLEALPLTPNGKIDRRVLPTPEWGEGEAKDNYVAPRTPAEELLADIWAEVLGIGKIGIHSNFFELGGHSLLASQVVLRVRKVFQASITLRELFESPTIAGLAVKLEAACRVDEGLQAPPLISVARGTSLPLSYAQQRLWFLDRLEPGSAAYNTPIALRLTGQLDLDLLQQTFSEIVRRHESLRTTFAEIDGQPIQLISPPTALNIPLTDLSPLPADEREAAARHAVSEHSRQPFNLSTGPLLRTTLLRLGAEEHVLLVTMHHIISDGWSLGVMVREIKALYAAYTAGEESPLADLDIQYADFAAWQREWLTGEVLDEQLSYWKEQLAGAPPVLELPTDRPRPPLQSYRGAQHSFTLSQELTRALRELSQREGCTLFMVLLTAFQVLLSRYSGQEDVVVGTPIANRNRSEIEGLIGFFVNTLALRTDLSGEPSFKDALKRVREVTLGAYGHQDVPFEKLVEELQPERSLSHQPLFQVMMVLQNAPRESLELPGLQLQLWSSESQTTKFDLLLSMSESQEGLSGAFEYSTDLFDEQTIQRFQRHFERLLEAIIVDAEQQVAAINVLSAAEHEQIVVQWNETSTEYPQESCVHQLFEEQVARTPEAIAVECAGEQLTYGELNERANQLAHHLRTLGVGSDSLVGVLLERSTEMVIALLGVLKAGAAYVPLDASHPAARLSFALQDAAASVLLTQQHLVEQLPAHGARVICLDSQWSEISNHSADPLAVHLSAEQLAYVIYTSGSTGQPKGVAVRHAAVVNFLSSMAASPGLSASDTVLALTSLAFDIAVLELLLPLAVGARVVIATREVVNNSQALKQLLRSSAATTLQATPATYHLLLENDRNFFHHLSLRQLLCGGEALTTELATQLVATGMQVWNLYGPTETTIWSSAQLVEQVTSSIALGRPIANTQLYVLDGKLRPTPVGVKGELYIGGEGLARGYVGRAELTAERFVPDPFSGREGARLYKTGDVVRYQAGGELLYLGRSDDQVKLRGYRIELGEIEAVLCQEEGISEAVVLTRGEGAEKRLVAYVVRAGGAEGDRSGELRRRLRERLPEYMVPARVVILERLPLTPNGKVDRKALESYEGVKKEEEFVAPRTPVEEVLARVWRKVLEVERVSVEANFFELGGHSLLAARVVHLIHQELKINLPLHTIFDEPTIAGLALIAQDIMIEEIENLSEDEAELFLDEYEEAIT